MAKRIGYGEWHDGKQTVERKQRDFPKSHAARREYRQWRAAERARKAKEAAQQS